MKEGIIYPQEQTTGNLTFSD